VKKDGQHNDIVAQISEVEGRTEATEVGNKKPGQPQKGRPGGWN
jgi:hypothetical protein